MAKCIPCLGSDVKDAIRTLGDKKLNSMLDSIGDCKGDREVNLCRVGKSGKATRGKSEYNIFVGECMRRQNITAFKDAPAGMKRCAAEWREKKGGVQAR